MKKWKNYIIGILMLTITLSLPMIHTVKADESEVVYEDNGGSKDRNMYTKQIQLWKIWRIKRCKEHFAIRL